MGNVKNDLACRGAGGLTAKTRLTASLRIVKEVEVQEALSPAWVF